MSLGVLFAFLGCRPDDGLQVVGQQTTSLTQRTEKPAATEDGYLHGTYVVRCPKGHDDRVDDYTRNHKCEKCGAKAVVNGKAIIVCPDGHTNQVSGVTESFRCKFKLVGGKLCGKECRR